MIGLLAALVVGASAPGPTCFAQDRSAAVACVERILSKSEKRALLSRRFALVETFAWNHPGLGERWMAAWDDGAEDRIREHIRVQGFSYTDFRDVIFQDYWLTKHTCPWSDKQRLADEVALAEWRSEVTVQISALEAEGIHGTFLPPRNKFQPRCLVDGYPR